MKAAGISAQAAGRGSALFVMACAAIAALLIYGIVRPQASEAEAVPAAHAPPPSAQADPAAHAAGHRQAEGARRFEQAVVMLHARQYEHAMVALHRLLEIAPEMPEAHVNMGYALLGLGRHAAARDFFRGAIELKPDQANAYYGLATALEAGGDLPGAIGAMRSYLHLARHEREQHLRRARAALWEWESRARELAQARP